MNISSIFYFSKSTSINTQYSSLWGTLKMMLFTKHLIKWKRVGRISWNFRYWFDFKSSIELDIKRQMLNLSNAPLKERRYFNLFSLWANEHIQLRFVCAKALLCYSPFRWQQLPVAATDCLHMIRLKSSHAFLWINSTKVSIIGHLTFLIFLLKNIKNPGFRHFYLVCTAICW